MPTDVTRRFWQMCRRSCLAGLCACILVIPVATAQQSQAQETPRDALLSHFYQDPRPERLIGFLEQFESEPSTKWESYPAVAGLFAVVFRADPAQIEKLVPARFNARTAETIAAALRLSGQHAMAEKLQPRFTQAGRDAKLAAEFSNLPARLEDLQIVTPTHLDILWGASFASGDGRFVAKILDFFATTADRSEPVAIDVTRTAIAMTGGPKDIYGELKSNYGEAFTRQIILAATALWAVESNARRHAFVNQALATYIDGHPGTPAQKALAALRPKALR